MLIYSGALNTIILSTTPISRTFYALLLSGMGMVDFSRTHDPMGYISPEHAQAALNVSLPVSMFMNMSHIPPRFFNQHQQNMQGESQGRWD